LDPILVGFVAAVAAFAGYVVYERAVKRLNAPKAQAIIYAVVVGIVIFLSIRSLAAWLVNR
jgi:hypothetical protein